MLRKAFRNLLNLDDPPERTALAFAVGAFIAFSPLLGLHTVIAAAIAVIWRFNKLAIFTGTYINNPWTLVPIVAASWAIGRQFVDAPEAALPGVSLGALATAEFWRMIAAQRWQLLPFAVGASILSIAAAAVSYPLVLYSLRAYRRKRRGRAPLGPSITEQS